MAEGQAPGGSRRGKTPGAVTRGAEHRLFCFWVQFCEAETENSRVASVPNVRAKFS